MQISHNAKNISKYCKKVLENPLPKGIVLNVNIPKLKKKK
jgi:5'-nucleotidase